MEPKDEIAEELSAPAQQPDYQSEIIEILRSPLTPALMRRQIRIYHENDVASAMELLSAEERQKLYSMLHTDTLARVLEYTSSAADYLRELSIRKRVEILSALETSYAAECLRQMEKNDRNTLLELLDPEIKREILLLSSFDADEIGSKMTTNYVSIRTGTGIRQAMRELVEQAAENDNISKIYVVDEDETLVGAIDLKDLIIAREGSALESITVTSYPYVYTNELIENCIERLRKYSEDSIPVLDAENKLTGVLTSHDIADLVGDELVDDYAKLAGLSAEEDLHEPLVKSIGKRLPWLMILLGLGMVVSGIVGLFEAVVTQLTLIVSFQSLVLGMAGNAGTQSLAVTIRVLMDDQISGKQKFLLIRKEAGVGLLNGLILCALSFVFIGLYLSLIKGEDLTMSFSVSLCTGLALLCSIFISSIFGTVIPILFKKMKIDPAVASGPLITTINDLVAVVSYYGLAWLLLINVLQL